MKKRLVKKVIISCLIAIFVLTIITVAFGVEFGIMPVTKIVGKNPYAALNQEEEETEIIIDQSIEKYFDIDEEKALLQQKIVVMANKDDIKKENEILQIETPTIQEQKPETAILLVNGDKAEESYYNYDVQTGIVKIEVLENKNISNVYKIIYEYNQIKTEEKQEILLNTTVYTKIENLDEIETKDEKSIELSKIGENVSINGNITSETYKGYLYEAKENETLYNENYIVEISNMQGVEEINIANEESNYTYEQKENKIVMPANDNIYFKRTVINQENIKKILGEEGEITLKNQNDDIIAKINKDSQIDENGNIIIEYANKEIKKIKILTSEPKQIGTLEFNNTKSISPDTGYSKEQLKLIEFLEEKIVVNESSKELKMKLLDTKTEAKIEINNENIATLNKNEDVQLAVTLLSNNNEQDLYKNPVIDIVFPEEVKEIDVKAISLLYTKDLKVGTAILKNSETGNKVIQIGLIGEQTQYESKVNQGICITIDGDILLDSLATSTESEIVLKYTNDNKKGEQYESKCPIIINSKQGVLTYSRAEGFNESNELVETFSNEIVEAKLDVKNSAKQIVISTAIVNNYEQAIGDVSIIGRIPTQGEGNSNLSMNLLGKIKTDKIDAQIYYSEDINALENSDSWTLDPQDYAMIKSYKIVLNNNEMQAKDKLNISYDLYVPENLDYNAITYHNYVVNYKVEDKELKNTSTICFKTKEKNVYQEGIGGINLPEEPKINEETKEEVIDKIGEISVSAVSGGQTIENGQELNEGQNVKYRINITNTNQKELNNVKVVAKNTNAIYYDIIKSRTEGTEEDSEYAYNYYYRENEELTQKDIEVERIKPGETVTLEYEISIKEVSEGEKTVGNIEISADNVASKNIETLTNPIKQAKLKVVINDLMTKSVQMHNDSNFSINIKVYNLSNVAQENIVLETKLPPELFFKESGLYLKEGFELLSYDEKTNVLKLKINKIEKSGVCEVATEVYTNNLGENKTVKASFYFTATTKDGSTYISNEIERSILQEESALKGEQTTNIETDEVQNGQKVEYITTLKNVGEIDEEIEVMTKMERGQIIDEIYYIYNGKKFTIKKENIDGRFINFETDLKQGEELVFVEKVTIDADNAINGEITNKVAVYAKKSIVEINDITLKLKDYKKPIDEEENEDKKDNYSISGVAWLDENKNGYRETTESSLKDIEVILIDGDNNIIQKTKTNENGDYQFENLKNGKYFVIFEYDSVQYRVTEYQKSGISQQTNSDVITKKITLEGEEKTVAITDSISIQNITQYYIDAGFIKNEKFDMALSKTISQIVVNNPKGTAVYNYNNATLAKVEIDAKNLEGSIVKITYQIKLTNNGEIAGYVNDIIDNCPNDMIFTKNDNKSWVMEKDSKLHYIALSDEIINPGETKTVNLILTKKMNTNNTGIIRNTAEIAKSSNKNNIKDTELNNTGMAETIISVRTGKIILYIALAISLLGLIVACIIYIKKIIKK